MGAACVRPAISPPLLLPPPKQPRNSSSQFDAIRSDPVPLVPTAPAEVPPGATSDAETVTSTAKRVVSTDLSIRGCICGWVSQGLPSDASFLLAPQIWIQTAKDATLGMMLTQEMDRSRRFLATLYVIRYPAPEPLGSLVPRSYPMSWVIYSSGPSNFSLDAAVELDSGLYCIAVASAAPAQGSFQLSVSSTSEVTFVVPDTVVPLFDPLPSWRPQPLAGGTDSVWLFRVGASCRCVLRAAAGVVLRIDRIGDPHRGAPPDALQALAAATRGIHWARAVETRAAHSILFPGLYVLSCQPAATVDNPSGGGDAIPGEGSVPLGALVTERVLTLQALGSHSHRSGVGGSAAAAGAPLPAQLPPLKHEPPLPGALPAALPSVLPPIKGEGGALGGPRARGSAQVAPLQPVRRGAWDDAAAGTPPPTLASAPSSEAAGSAPSSLPTSPVGGGGSFGSGAAPASATGSSAAAPAAAVLAPKAKPAAPVLAPVPVTITPAPGSTPVLPEPAVEATRAPSNWPATVLGGCWGDRTPAFGLPGEPGARWGCSPVFLLRGGGPVDVRLECNLSAARMAVAIVPLPDRGGVESAAAAAAAAADGVDSWRTRCLLAALEGSGTGALAAVSPATLGAATLRAKLDPDRRYAVLACADLATCAEFVLTLRAPVAPSAAPLPAAADALPALSLCWMGGQGGGAPGDATFPRAPFALLHVYRDADVAVTLTRTPTGDPLPAAAVFVLAPPPEAPPGAPALDARGLLPADWTAPARLVARSPWRTTESVAAVARLPAQAAPYVVVASTLLQGEEGPFALWATAALPSVPGELEAPALIQLVAPPSTRAWFEPDTLPQTLHFAGSWRAPCMGGPPTADLWMRNPTLELRVAQLGRFAFQMYRGATLNTVSFAVFQRDGDFIRPRFQRNIVHVEGGWAARGATLRRAWLQPGDYLVLFMADQPGRQGDFYFTLRTDSEGLVCKPVASQGVELVQPYLVDGVPATPPAPALAQQSATAAQETALAVADSILLGVRAVPFVPGLSPLLVFGPSSGVLLVGRMRAALTAAPRCTRDGISTAVEYADDPDLAVAHPCPVAAATTVGNGRVAVFTAVHFVAAVAASSRAESTGLDGAVLLANLLSWLTRGTPAKARVFVYGESAQSSTCATLREACASVTVLDSLAALPDRSLIDLLWINVDPFSLPIAARDVDAVLRLAQGGRGLCVCGGSPANPLLAKLGMTACDDTVLPFALPSAVSSHSALVVPGALPHAGTGAAGPGTVTAGSVVASPRPAGVAARASGLPVPAVPNSSVAGGADGSAVAAAATTATAAAAAAAPSAGRKPPTYATLLHASVAAKYLQSCADAGRLPALAALLPAAELALAAAVHLPPGDTFLRPLLVRAFAGLVLVDPWQPLSPEHIRGPYERLALALSAADNNLVIACRPLPASPTLDSTPPSAPTPLSDTAKGRAHPSALVFPGTVPPAGVPRRAFAAEVPLTPGSRAFLGAWAVAGEPLTIVLPATAADLGLRVRIGAHTLDPTRHLTQPLRRLPHLSSAFSVTVPRRASLPVPKHVLAMRGPPPSSPKATPHGLGAGAAAAGASVSASSKSPGDGSPVVGSGGAESPTLSSPSPPPPAEAQDAPVGGVEMEIVTEHGGLVMVDAMQCTAPDVAARLPSVACVWVAGAPAAAVFGLGVTPPEQWPEMLASSSAPMAVLSSARIALVLSAASCARHNPTRIVSYWDALAAALDDVVPTAQPTRAPLSLLVADVQCEPGCAVAAAAPDVALHPDDMHRCVHAAAHRSDPATLRFVLRALACSRALARGALSLNVSSTIEVDRVIDRALALVPSLSAP